MKKQVLITIVALNSVAFAVPVRARNITWEGASPVVITLIVLLFIVAIAGIIVGIVYQEKQRNLKLEEHSEHQFLRQCERFGLSANEIFSLRNYLKHINIVSYPAVFNSVSIFEEAVDRECELITNKWGFTPKSENATIVISSIRRKLGYDRLLSEVPLQSTRNFEVGQTLELLPEVGSQIKIANVVVMQSSELVMSLHYNPKNITFDLANLKTVVLSYTRQADGIYTVPVEIVENDISTGTLRVLQSFNIDRKQFRDNVRMQLDLPLKCRLLHRRKADKNAPLGKLVENSFILDISGGGMAFIADTALDEGDRLSLSFSLDARQFVLKGEVVGVMNKERRGDVRYKHRVVFKDVKHSDADAIVRFIFQKQREQMHVNFNEHKN